jgi:hypothetical protein
MADRGGGGGAVPGHTEAEAKLLARCHLKLGQWQTSLDDNVRLVQAPPLKSIDRHAGIHSALMRHTDRGDQRLYPCHTHTHRGSHIEIYIYKRWTGERRPASMPLPPTDTEPGTWARVSLVQRPT